MKKATRPLALIIAMGVLLGTIVSPVYAQVCPEHLDATIDIKPGGFPNPINLKSNGLLPVALLGAADFDVTDVDLDSVGLHPIGRCEETSAPVKFAFTDVNHDGFADIVFQFKTADLTLQVGDTEVCLHGDIGGLHFCGHDDVIVKD